MNEPSTTSNRRPGAAGDKRRRWRIAHFHLGRCNPESANGIDQMIFHVSARQAEAGHDVRVASLTREPAIPIPDVRVRTYHPPVEAPGFLPAWIRDLAFERAPWNLSPRLIEDLLEDRPDVVHFHHTQVPQAVRVSRILRRHDVPYCVTLHGAMAAPARDRRRWMKRAFMALAERGHLDGAAFLHAVSRLDADGARSLGLRAPVEVIPNGVDARTIRARQTTPLAGRYPELGGRRILLFVGRLDPEQKGLDVLLEAFGRAPDDLGLALVGPSFRDSRGRLEEMTRHLGIGERVVFLGPLFGDAKYECIAAADLFVYPSRWDGLPLAPLEAAASGRGCILTSASDPTGLLTSEGGAILCEPTVDGIRSALRRAAALSDEELALMGKRARATVLEHFDWVSLTDRLIDAYRRHCRTP